MRGVQIMAMGDTLKHRIGQAGKERGGEREGDRERERER